MTDTMIVKGVLGVLITGIVVFCFIYFKDRRGEIILLLVSTAIALVVGEFALKTFFPQVDTYSSMFEYDSTLGWKFVSNAKGRMVLTAGGVANTIETNSLGFRDHAPSAEKKNKIMVLGDSYVTNVSVKDKDVFTEVMENQLKDTDVLNFGVNAYGEVQEYLLLQKWVDVIKPDLILLIVYLENDFSDIIGDYWVYTRPYASLDGKDSILTLHPQSTVQPPPTDLSGNFITKSNINTLVNRSLHRLLRKPEVIIPFEFYTCQSPLSEDYLVRYRILEALLLKIEALAKEKNIPIVFVLAPSRLQVNDKLWNSFLESNKSSNMRFIRSLPDDKLMHFAAKNNLLMLDLLPVLLSESRNHRVLYHPRDLHWTKEANQVVANALMDYLKSKSLIE